MTTETDLHLIERRLARIEQTLLALEHAHAYGFVYIAGDRQGRYKIRASQDTEKRMKAIATTSAQPDLILTIRTDNHYTLEKTLHMLYRKAQRHIIREWYALAQPDIDALAELPQPLYIETLPGILAAVSNAVRRPIAKPTAPTNNGKHPSLEEAHELKHASRTQRVLALMRQKASQNQIISEVWQINGKGAAYQRACEELREIQAQIAAALVG